MDGLQKRDQIAFHLQPAVAVGVAELKVRMQQYLPEGRPIVEHDTGHRRLGRLADLLAVARHEANRRSSPSPAGFDGRAAVRRPTSDGRRRRGRGFRLGRGRRWRPVHCGGPVDESRASEAGRIEDSKETWEHLLTRKCGPQISTQDNLLIVPRFVKNTSPHPCQVHGLPVISSANRSAP